MRPRELLPRVRLRGPDVPAFAFVGALAQAACTHAEPLPPAVVAEPAPTRPTPPPVVAPPAPPPTVAPTAPQVPPSGAVVLGADPTVGRVRVVEQDKSAPYYQVGDYRTRVGPRWYSRATGAPVRHDDPAFLRWLRAHSPQGQR